MRRPRRAEPSLVGAIRMPDPTISPLLSLLRRLAIALGALVITALIVYFGRDGYRDAYGDRPDQPRRRVLLRHGVGLHHRLRRHRPGQRHRPADHHHRGHAAAADLPHHLRRHHRRAAHRAVAAVVPDPALEDPRARPHRRRRLRHQGARRGRDAARRRRRARPRSSSSTPTAPSSTPPRRAGLVTVAGNATRSSVLRVAGVPLAQGDRGGDQPRRHRRPRHADGAGAGARHPHRRVGAGVGERAPAAAVRGASSVVVSAETAGRLLGAATTTPTVVEVIEDLLTPDAGFAISERDVEDVRGRRLAAAPRRHRARRGARGRAAPRRLVGRRRAGGGRPAALRPQGGPARERLRSWVHREVAGLGRSARARAAWARR